MPFVQVPPHQPPHLGTKRIDADRCHGRARNRRLFPKSNDAARRVALGDAHLGCLRLGADVVQGDRIAPAAKRVQDAVQRKRKQIVTVDNQKIAPDVALLQTEPQIANRAQTIFVRRGPVVEDFQTHGLRPCVRPCEECIDEHMVGHHHPAVNPGRRQPLDDIIQHRPPRHRQQVLGNRERQWMESVANPAHKMTQRTRDTSTISGI